MAGERLILWTSAAAAAATAGAVAIAAFVIWNVTAKERAQFTSQVASLNAQVVALNDKVDKTNVTVADIKKIATLEDTAKSLDRLNAEIQKTNQRLTAMQKESSLDGVKASMAQLIGKIDGTGAALADLKKSVAAGLGKGDLAAIGNRLTSLAADIQARLAATEKSLAAGIETNLAATEKSLAEIKMARQQEAGTQTGGDSARDKADAARDKTDAARDKAIAKLESTLAELKTGIADNASAQNKSLAEIASSIAALKTTAAAAQAAARQAAEKTEKALAVARAPEAAVPETTASIPISQPLTIRFGTAGRTNLDAQTNTVIANLRSIMKDRNGCTISVAGYTDTLGRDDVNLDVSKARADAVAAKLKTAFADRNVRIDAIGWGERHLKVWTRDGKREMANRRVAVSVECKG